MNHGQIWEDRKISKINEISEKNMKNQNFQTFKTFRKSFVFHSRTTFMHPRSSKRCEKYIPGITAALSTEGVMILEGRKLGKMLKFHFFHEKSKFQNFQKSSKIIWIPSPYPYPSPTPTPP